MSTFLILLLSWNCFASDIEKADVERVYTIGIVPQFDIRRLHDIWTPILNELQARTGYRFMIRGSATIPTFEQELISGTFDFAYINPFHALIANRSVGYIPLLKDVGRQLHGIIVVAKDSPIESVTELAGKTIAYPAPNALGATLLVKAELQDKYGISTSQRYVLTHSSVYLNVALGEVVAGGGVQKTLDRQSPAIREAVKVLYKTRGVAAHPIASHPRVPESVRQDVIDALLAIGKTEAGKALLARIPMKQIDTASLTDYKSIDDMKLERFYQKF